MAIIKFNKVLTLPETLEPNTFYFVENGTFAESYITDAEGSARSVGNSAMVNALVNAALADWTGNASAMEIVPDIAARDALTADLDRNAMILVVDASGDPTVGSGSALYAYGAANATVYKVAEYESMDVVIQWSAIQGGPSSTPAHIDEAVSLRHNHTNKATLDKISADAEGLLYDGAPVGARWSTANW
jgi:hypothetical protein